MASSSGERVLELSFHILEKVDESESNEVERRVLSLASFLRWVVDGGFRTYLRMPASADSRLVFDHASEYNLRDVAQSLRNALDIFGGADFSNVEVRQSIEIDNEMDALLMEQDERFEQEIDRFCDSVIEYAVKNRENIRASF